MERTAAHAWLLRRRPELIISRKLARDVPCTSTTSSSDVSSVLLPVLIERVIERARSVVLQAHIVGSLVSVQGPMADVAKSWADVARGSASCRQGGRSRPINHHGSQHPPSGAGMTVHVREPRGLYFCRWPTSSSPRWPRRPAAYLGCSSTKSALDQDHPGAPMGVACRHEDQAVECRCACKHEPLVAASCATLANPT
jgi:hypothetical protein